MRPPNWKPPVELSPAEEKVVKRIRKAKLFVFLREIRHQLFNDEFQQELATFFLSGRRTNLKVLPNKGLSNLC